MSSGQAAEPAQAEPGEPAQAEPGEPAQPAARPAEPAEAAQPAARPSVVALGGGHGLAVTLQALRRYAGDITAVVSVADDGGSSGRLRAIAGMLAPGDIRRCLIALADPSTVWSRAFAYRFAAGDLAGHALGNVIIAGLAEVTGDFATALQVASDLLGVTGRVLPATRVPVHLKAEVGGAEVVGQVNVTQVPDRISAVSLVPPDAPSAPEVASAVKGADQVVIGPGSLFTSVLATCVVPSIHDALAKRSGGRVYVCNLRPQLQETARFQPVDHLEALLAHGVPVDAVVVDRAYGDAAGAGPSDAAGPLTALRDAATRAGISVVAGDLARPDRGAHDVAALAAVLAGLAGLAEGTVAGPG